MNEPFLKLGSRGKYVGILQQSLSLGGHYKGAIDKDFGPLTHDALVNCQRQYGLKPDGAVGMQTWINLLVAGVFRIRRPIAPLPANLRRSYE